MLEAQAKVCTGPTQTRPLTEEQAFKVLDTILRSVCFCLPIFQNFKFSKLRVDINEKETFERELQNLEDEQNNRVHDFTFIYSKFLSSLPSSMDEFRCSVHLVFPHILDVSHLMKEIGLMKKVTNLPAAISYLKRRFFAPIDMKISHQDDASESNIHGHDVLRISELFAKLCTILKIAPVTHEDENGHLPYILEDYTNIFNPCSTSSQDHTIDEDVSVWTDNKRKVDSKDLVFLWGFRGGMSARTLKKLLHDSRDVFSEEFDVRLLDKSYLDVFKVRMKKGKALSCNHGIRGKEVTEILITRSFCG
ncbi:unnamed protein product [Camellia sinensis]